VIAREDDNGDFWELYKNLDGFQNVIMTRPIPVPARGKAQFSDEFKDKPGKVMRGPVYTEFQVKHPLGNNSVSKRVRVYNGINRIDFSTGIVNNDKHVRYQVLFPTSITGGKRFDEIPFGAIERPQAQEYPAQNWVDFGNGNRGVALINKGNPGNNVADGTLMMSVLRSTQILFYGEDGSYERGMTSNSGQMLGREVTTDYALLPHSGTWSDASVVQAGLEFNNTLIVTKTEAHAGQLGKQWGLAEISAPNATISALKTAKDGSTVIRVYESAGKPASGATLTFNSQVRGAEEVGLMEGKGKRANVSDRSIRFHLKPFEIKTFKLKLAAP
jgi:alpha-mannosidase